MGWGGDSVWLVCGGGEGRGVWSGWVLVGLSEVGWWVSGWAAGWVGVYRPDLATWHRRVVVLLVCLVVQGVAVCGLAWSGWFGIVVRFGWLVGYTLHYTAPVALHLRRDVLLLLLLLLLLLGLVFVLRWVGKGFVCYLALHSSIFVD